MQGNDFVTSQMYTRGVVCFSCDDVHGTENNAGLVKPANVLSLEMPRPGLTERTASQPSKRTRITKSAVPGTIA